jgi:transposase
VLSHLDLSAIHQAYRCERGRPPFHPQAMVGLLLYGACRGIYSSRTLAQACRDHLAFMYLTGRLQPDFHTIAQFRRRFRPVLHDLFRQVLELCRQAGLVRLGHVSLDGTKVRANASKHQAMSYGRMGEKERALEEEIRRWFEEAERQDAEEDEAYGPEDDGYRLPEELREAQKRLETIRAARARLEAEARARAAAEGTDPAQATPPDRAQSNFTDADSRIMPTPEGFQQCYNAQVAVDAESQVIVAQDVSRAPPDVEQLRPMLERLIALHGRPPAVLTADAGYASEANFAALAQARVYALIALRRYRHDERLDADPAPARATDRWPHRNEMRRRLSWPASKALYRLRTQTVEPVIGQIKAARRFRQFLCRGLEAVQAEWALVCTAHNLLKLQKALAVA